MPRPQSEAQARSRGSPVPKARRKPAWKGTHMKLRSKIQHSMIMVITVTLLAAYALTTLVIYRQNVGLMERETRQEADYIVKAIEISGTDYLKQMDEVEKNTRNERLLLKRGRRLFLWHQFCSHTDEIRNGHGITFDAATEKQLKIGAKTKIFRWGSFLGFPVAYQVRGTLKKLCTSSAFYNLPAQKKKF